MGSQINPKKDLLSRLIDIIKNNFSDDIASMKLDIRAAYDNNDLTFTRSFMAAAHRADNGPIKKVPVGLYKLILECHMGLLEKNRIEENLKQTTRNIIFTQVGYISPILGYISRKEGNDDYAIGLAKKHKTLFSDFISSCGGAHLGRDSFIAGQTGMSAIATQLNGYLAGFNSGPPPFDAPPLVGAPPSYE